MFDTTSLRATIERDARKKLATILPATLLAWTLTAPAQILELPSARAPSHALTATQRRPLSLSTTDPAWTLAAIRGTPPRERPLVLPPSHPGEPLQIGVNSQPPQGPIRAASAGTITKEGPEIIWRVRIDAPAAAATRLHLTNLNLPPTASVTIAGSSTGYVIRGRGALGAGDEWTPILDGEHAYLEYRGPISHGLPQLAIEEVSEIPALPAHAGSVTDLLPCEVDVTCQTVDPTARDSVGFMVYSTGAGTFACTGALLNDADIQTTIGWFLTSNRCINTAAAAASLTVYWFYQSAVCDGPAPDIGTLPVSQGSTLEVSAAGSDASLLRLAQDPSQGQGLAGWSGAEPTGPLTTIHHPLGDKKRIAIGAGTTQSPICFGQLGHYQYHYLNYTLGITESGSSGAPLFNSAWQVVGQYFGPCAISTPTCNNPNQWNAVFGRFSRTLPLVCSRLSGQAAPTRVYVDDSATGAGTGTSWADAYTSLAAAIANTCVPPDGLEVWVAEGVYKPLAGDRESAFQLLRAVAIFGGFAGNETLLEQRNVLAHPTVLSGDMAGDDGPNFTNRSDNAYHVVRGTGADQTAVLDGFVIGGGNANGPMSFNDSGGGLYVEGGSPRVRNCTFEDNSGGFGGGAVAYFIGGTADVQGCVFRGNRGGFGGAVSLTGSGGGFVQCFFQDNTSVQDGGAVDMYESSPVFTECTFSGNASGVRGGAASMFASGSVAFVECRFAQNSAQLAGGAANSESSTSTMRRCVFAGNAAVHYGGAYVHTFGSHATITECRFLGNSSGQEGGAVHANSGTLTLANSELSGNHSLTAGGGLWHNEHCQTAVLNTTFSLNTAGTVGGGAAFEDGVVSVTNCVFSGNTDSGGGGQNGQLKLLAGADATLRYNLVAGWTGSLGGEGNIGGDPLFLAPLGLDAVAGTDDDDLALGTGSPAIDAGDSPAAQSLSTDVRGNARREDDPCSPDTGVGAAPVVDMGAIETAPCGCYANCDGSTLAPVLTANDFQCFINAYASGASYANCDGSTLAPVLTANDFQCFINQYAGGCP